MAQQYSFPHVAFRESIIGPIPFRTTYRNRVGIAGPFRRGPRGATRISTRQDASYLYGNDNSAGSVALRQVMMQGATDLIISRATPQSTESTFAIRLSSTLPTNEAKVGYNGNVQQFNNGAQVKTTGLKLDVRYVGDAIETVRAAGTFTVSAASTLPASVYYSGLGLFELVVENYLKGGDELTTAASLSNRSNDLSFTLTAQTTYTLNQEFTLSSLTSTNPVEANQIYVLSSGMQITIQTDTTKARVTKNPGTLAAATHAALEVKTLQLTSLPVNLSEDSYLYFTNATFKVVDTAQRSNSTVSVKGTLSSSNATVSLVAGSKASVEHIIAKNAEITASATYLPEAPLTVEEQVQWVYVDKTLVVNQAFIANLKPGRLIYSGSSVNFNQTSGRPLQVLSVPTIDLTSPNRVRFLVKGQIAGALSNAKVHLYESPTNLYVFSNTFRVNSGALPQYVKKAPAQVTTSNVAYSNGASSITVTSLPYKIDSGFIINFGTAGYFTISANANAGNNVALTGTLVGNIPASTTGTLSDPMTYSYIQTLFDVEKRDAVVDSFVVSQEAVKTNNFDHRFMFERSDGVVFYVSSGVLVDLPGVGSSNKIAFIEGGTFNIPVAYASVGIGTSGGQAEFPVGKTASQILADLKRAIELDVTMTGLISEPELSTALNPPSLNLKSSYVGTDANRIKAIVTREVVGTSSGVTADDFLLNAVNLPDSNANWLPTAIKSFSGAVNGSTAASVDLYSIDSDPLVRIIALSDGEYGNKLRVSVVPQTDGQFTLYIVDEDSQAYQSFMSSETLTLSTRDVSTNGLFNASANSQLVRCFYLPVVSGKELTEEELNKVPMRLAPSYGDRIPVFNTAVVGASLPIYAQAAVGQAYLQNVYLQNGSDANMSAMPASERAKVYRKAVQELEKEDIAILLCAGFDAGDQNYSGVVEEIVGQVSRADTMTGLRFGLIQAPRNLSQTQAQAIASSLNNPRVVLVGGHVSMQGIPGFNNTPVVGLYAGLLASNSPELAPDSAGEGMLPMGVLSVDTPATTTYLDSITKARVEALYYDSGIGAFKFLNGLSTTSDYRDRYVSIRRTSDQILHDLYNNLIWIRSSRNTEGLRSRVASAVDAYLQNLVREERISSYRPTVCNESNNTPNSIGQGILNIAITYTPVFPASFILVNVTREVQDTLSINTL